MAEQYLTSVDDPNVYPAKTMVELLQSNAKKYAGKDLYYLLEDGTNISERITHDEAFIRAKAIAAALQKHGKKGERVLLLFPTGFEFVISMFACFLSGLIAVPAYPPHRRKANQRFLSIFENAEPSIILTTGRIRNDIEHIKANQEALNKPQLIVFEEIDEKAERWMNPGIDQEDIAFLQYTSGSTGRPNGVMVSHGNIIHNSECIKQSFGFDENLRGINWLPNFHDMGLIGCLLQPAYVGGMNIIIPPIKFIQNPLNWLEGISKYKATNAGGPNFAFDYVTEKAGDDNFDHLDLSSLTTMYNGAEPVRSETIIKFSKKFINSKFHHKQFYPCYGLAESVLIASGGDSLADPIYFEADMRALEENKVMPVKAGKDVRSLTSCGYPWLGMSICIVDPESCKPTPTGEIGEIWIKGPSVTKGYWNNDAGTEKTYRAIISGKEDGPWMRSGDLGFIHKGQLYVSGRLKELIIIRGSNFFPNDLEYSIENSHEAIRPNSSAAFSTEINNEERVILLAEIERTQMRELNEDEVFEAIRNTLFEEYGVQAHGIVLMRTGSTLKTSSGKTQRIAMKKAWLNNELNVIASWEMKVAKENGLTEENYPPEMLHEWMIKWMAQTLEIDPEKIDPDKPVSAYGLDSITAVSLERDVNKQFGVEWPIESFLKDNSVNQLVEEGVLLLRNKTSRQ